MYYDCGDCPVLRGSHCCKDDDVSCTDARDMAGDDHMVGEVLAKVFSSLSSRNIDPEVDTVEWERCRCCGDPTETVNGSGECTGCESTIND